MHRLKAEVDIHQPLPMGLAAALRRVVPRRDASAFLIAMLCLAVLGARPVFAADDAPPTATNALPSHSEAKHSITIGGRTLDYRGVAETIDLTDRKGEPTASVYTVSYIADAPADASRPVSFVFNGGPGAASVFLHLGALGPRVLDTPESGAVPAPPPRLIDNPSSWLAFTDLVFVDPVGTGFSRGKGKDENPEKAFWNVQSDINSLGAVLRRWLSRHERWSAPVYLVGESYGGLRAAALAHSLERDVGLTVSGMVLVSPALDIALLHPDVGALLAPAFELPSYAATVAALAGKETAVDEGETAARFALSDYLVGLAAQKGIPAVGDPFIARVAALVGLREEVVRREHGRVSSDVFAHELRRSQGELLSQYDATVKRATRANPWDDRAGDPVLDPAIAAYTTAFDTYAPEALGYRTEQPYRVLPREVAQHWDWDGARGGEGGLGLALKSLQDTLLAHPETKVLVVNGRYDLVTPYLASRWLVDQLALSPAVRAQIRLRVYEGGHMMYMRPSSRAALAADAAALFAAPK